MVLDDGLDNNFKVRILVCMRFLRRRIKINSSVENQFHTDLLFITVFFFNSTRRRKYMKS